MMAASTGMSLEPGLHRRWQSVVRRLWCKVCPEDPFLNILQGLRCFLFAGGVGLLHWGKVQSTGSAAKPS